MTLRRSLWGLENHPEVDDAPEAIVHQYPIGLNGRLVPLSEEEDSRLEYEVGPQVPEAPRALGEAVARIYGDTLSPREINLVVAGAEFMALVVQQWVRTEPIPE